MNPRRQSRPLLGLTLALLSLLPIRAAAIVGPSTDGASVAPYVIMVLNRHGNTAGFCSGLVVAPGAVLTAAHCVPAGATVKVHYRDAANAPVLLDTAEIVRHPAYRSNAIEARERSIDLALIQLAAPLPPRFRPARYGGSPVAAVGSRFRLAGFGLTRESDPRSSGHLRIAVIVARPPLSGVLLWGRDPASQGTGACTGDSGGPVFGPDDDTAVALTAWSAGNGPAQCGTLTQAVWLGPQKAWIDGILARWNHPPPR